MSFHTRVLYPGSTLRLKFLSGFHDPTRVILYSDGMTTEDVVVPVPNGLFAQGSDAELLGCGSPIQYRHGQHTFHANPVYHHKLVLDGVARANYPNTWCGMPGSGQFGSDSGESGTAERPTRWCEHFVSMPTPPVVVLRCRYGSRIFDAVPKAAFSVLGMEITKINGVWIPVSIGAGYDVVYSETEYDTSFRIPDLTRLATDPINWTAFRLQLEQYCRENSVQDPEELIPLVRAKLSSAIQDMRPDPAQVWDVDYSAYQPTGSLPPIEVVIENIKQMVQRYDANYYKSFRSKFAWGDLAASAYSSLDYADNNGIMYLKEATELKESAVSYADTLRRVASKSGAKRAKALAAAYLGLHYGWKLTLMDTADYIKLLRKNMSNDMIHRCASSSSQTIDDWSVSARYQVLYTRKDVGGSPETAQVNAFLEKVDFMPTLENIWDSVPYSFVIDWFTSVGDNLTNIGNLNVLHSYNNVLVAYESVTARRNIILAPSYGAQVYFDGSAYEQIYERCVRRTPTMPAIQPSSQQPASPLNHLVEGVALVVSRVL